MDRRRLFYYLLLNVFVSACVTSAILYWYDRNYRAVTLPQVSIPSAVSNSAGSTPAATVQKGLVQIVSVIGAGTLDAEAVVVKYNGEGELDLTGWHLKDAQGTNTYTFPSFKLFKGGAVQVHTQSGSDTAIDLYWGQRQSVWQSGEAVLLTDPSGQAQDSYPVP
jgi:Lamin Tail Domain